MRRTATVKQQAEICWPLGGSGRNAHQQARTQSTSTNSCNLDVLWRLLCTVWVKKNPPEVIWIFLIFFHKWLRIFIDFLRAYYTFLWPLDYKLLFNYLQLCQSYAILSATT